MPLTLENATREELRAYPLSAQHLFGALAERCKTQHGREAVPGRLALQGFCACGHHNIGNGGKLCGVLRELEELDLESDAAIDAWLVKARALNKALDLALVSPVPTPKPRQPAE